MPREYDVAVTQNSAPFCAFSARQNSMRRMSILFLRLTQPQDAANHMTKIRRQYALQWYGRQNSYKHEVAFRHVLPSDAQA